MILIHRLGEKVKVIGILGYSGYFDEFGTLGRRWST